MNDHASGSNQYDRIREVLKDLRTKGETLRREMSQIQEGIKSFVDENQKIRSALVTRYRGDPLVR